MQIFIKTFESKTSVLDIQDTSSIAQLKAAIFHKEGIPVNCQNFVFGSRYINNDENQLSLSNLSVGDGSTLRLVLPIRGGSRHAQVMQIETKSMVETFNSVQIAAKTVYEDVREKLIAQAKMKKLAKDMLDFKKMTDRQQKWADETSLLQARIEHLEDANNKLSAAKKKKNQNEKTIQANQKEIEETQKRINQARIDMVKELKAAGAGSTGGIRLQAVTKKGGILKKEAQAQAQAEAYVDFFAQKDPQKTFLKKDGTDASMYTQLCHYLTLTAGPLESKNHDAPFKPEYQTTFNYLKICKSIMEAKNARAAVVKLKENLQTLISDDVPFDIPVNHLAAAILAISEEKQDGKLAFKPLSKLVKQHQKLQELAAGAKGRTRTKAKAKGPKVSTVSKKGPKKVSNKVSNEM